VFERIDTSTTPERAAIFTIGVDGKHLRQVTPWKLDGNDPDWSPDGSLIAFNASAEPSPTQNIYTIKPDGTGLKQLTTYNEAGQATFHPSWSPDGTQILYSHNPSTDGWADFFIMNRDGSDQHVVARTALHENHGYWGRSPAP
jgi:TolB protein